MRRNPLSSPRQSAAAAACTAFISILVLGSAGCEWHHDGGSSSTAPPIPAIVPPGSWVTVNRDVQGFNAVALEGVGSAFIEHGASESLTISADEALIPYLTSEVSAGTLILGLDLPSTNQSVHSISFDVTVVNLDRVELTGVGGIDARHIDTPDFGARLTGVGDVFTEGRADRQEIVLSGVGAYRGGSLSSRVTHVDLTGVNLAVVRASERLTGFVGGLSVLEYYGDPVVAITGNGTLRRLGP